MHLLDVLAMAVGLGMDAMSVSAAIGVRWHGPRQKFRLAWHAGLFQFLMPILGYLAGSELATLLKSVGTYLAAALVFLVGAKMLYEALKTHPGAAAEAAEHAVEHDLGNGDRHRIGEKRADLPAGRQVREPVPISPAGRDPTRGWSLVVLTVATSLDALVVGFSLGIKGQTSILWPSAVIGVVAAAMSLAGVMIGQHAGKALGRWAEVVGAVVLMLLAVSFLVW
jgi:manganese efflux pump family protein